MTLTLDKIQLTMLHHLICNEVYGRAHLLANDEREFGLKLLDTIELLLKPIR
jgi:hypothetical protein